MRGREWEGKEWEKRGGEGSAGHLSRQTDDEDESSGGIV